MEGLCQEPYKKSQIFKIPSVDVVNIEIESGMNSRMLKFCVQTMIHAPSICLMDKDGEKRRGSHQKIRATRVCIAIPSFIALEGQ